MQKLLDLTGMSLSAVCLAHCLILPVAALLLPILGELAQTEWMHWVFLAVAAPVGLLAVGAAANTKRGLQTVLPFVGLGLALLLVGALDYPTHTWGSALTVVGALSLSWAHLYNWRGLGRVEPVLAETISGPMVPPGCASVLSK